MANPVNILHLSDLHFGKGDEPTPDAQRKNTLDGLIETLKRVEEDWKPHLIAITGDVGWKARESDYDQAREWFEKKLMPAFDLKSEHLVICPGNHDLDRKKAKFVKPPDNHKEADDWLSIENIDLLGEDITPFVLPFKNYWTFLDKMKCFSLYMGKAKHHLSGVRTIAGIRFVVLNSAWFSRGEQDRGNLWIGLPLIQMMEAENGLANLDQDKDAPPTIALVHHSPGWLHDDESVSKGSRIAALSYLARKCDLILTGHLHGVVQDPDRLCNRAMNFKAGATFSGDQHRNNASIFQLDTENRMFSRRWFEWDPAFGEWEERTRDNKPVLIRKIRESSHPAAEPLAVPPAYERYIQDQCRDMDITHLRGGAKPIKIDLPRLFIPLYSHPSWEKPKKKKADPGLLREESKPRDLEELIGENDFLVIRGLAGSGKTTLMRHLAFQVMEHSGPESLNGYVPVLIFLKHLKEFSVQGAAENMETAKNMVSMWADKTESGMDVKTLEAFCSQGRALFLLDGLDEIGDDLRSLVAASFAALRRKHPQCRVVLSGRPHGINETVMKYFGDRCVDILPLSMEQVEYFIKNWFIHVSERRAPSVDATAKGMMGEIRSHPTIGALIQSPLMLTAVCLLYLDDRKLPGQRAELYDRFVTNLLNRRFNDPEKVRNFLMALAHEMHKKRVKGMDGREAVNVLGCEYLPEKKENEKECKLFLENTFQRIEPNCGLLHLKNGQYEFVHLTFQEFLTAEFMVANETGDPVKTLKKIWEDPWCKEVVELYIGYHSIKNREASNRIVRKMLEQPDKPPFYRSLLAVRSLCDIHANKRNMDGVKLAKEKLWEIIHSKAEPKTRARAGEILGRLGDDRDLEVFVDVEPGEYELSTGKATIRPFQMSKYLVTNGWYEQFVKAGGYRNPEFWTGNGRKWLEYTKAEHPEYWHEHQWNCPNHPVVGVCWWEASAFCKWLTLSRQDGWTYRLPMDREWEAAATGKEKRKYPWGNEFDPNKCNTRESKIERTSAVGIFESGNTPAGKKETKSLFGEIADLAGNVWEWCNPEDQTDIFRDDFPFEREVQKLFDKEDYLEAYQVYDKKYKSHRPYLQGGSWDFEAECAVCASRLITDPSDRSFNVGFRCARTKK